MRCGPRGRRKRLRGRQGAAAAARRLRSHVIPVFVGSKFVAGYPTIGGSFWVPLQYVLGLRALGVEAYWLELLWPQSDVARARRCLRTFQRYVEALGVADWVTVVLFPDHERDDPPGREESFGARAKDLWARAHAGLLLNMANSVPASLRGRFARAARRRALAAGVARRPSARVAGAARDSGRALHGGDPVVERCLDGAGERGDRGPQAHELPPRPRAAPTGAGPARARREHPFRGNGRPGPPHPRRLASRGPCGGGGNPRGLSALRAAVTRRVRLRQALVRAHPSGMGERPHCLLPG